jgi:hypothetical protein
MRRLPTHEPWSEHEDINPSLYTPDQTGNDSPIAPAVPDPEGPKLGVPPTNPAIGFAGGQTGTLAAFNNLTPSMQKAIIWAAETYYKTFAKSLIITSAYRSDKQQEDIRNAWKAAGGSSTRPTVNTVKYGTLTTPAEDSKHSSRTAVDVPVYQAKWLAKSGVLKTCGLSQPSPQVDPGHIQL